MATILYTYILSVYTVKTFNLLHFLNQNRKRNPFISGSVLNDGLSLGQWIKEKAQSFIETTEPPNETHLHLATIHSVR